MITGKTLTAKLQIATTSLELADFTVKSREPTEYETNSISGICHHVHYCRAHRVNDALTQWHVDDECRNYGLQAKGRTDDSKFYGFAICTQEISNAENDSNTQNSDEIT